MNYFLHSAEMVGTAAFALSGALLAIHKRMDLFGVIVLGVTTALGGGTIRDILLGLTPPRMFYNYEYLTLAALVSLALFLAVELSRGVVHRFKGWLYFVYVFSDALGLGIFSVAGTQVGIDAGYEKIIFLCVFLGTATGVGGGILRDIMCGDIPFILKKHIYAVASIAGSITFYLLFQAGLREMPVSLAGVAVTLITRLLAWHFHWNLPQAPVLEDEKTSV